MAQVAIRLKVNGVQHESAIEPRLTLADFLRSELGLTGTHLGCEHGACGACTVLLDGEAVRSCLLFAVQAQGHEVTTIEGLAQDEQLHPIQEAFWEQHGLQCGFCTPGFILSAYNLLQENAHPSEEEIQAAISGNLCRCTGYQSIVASVKAAAEKLQPRSES